MRDHHAEAEAILAAGGASTEQALFAAAHAILAVNETLRAIGGERIPGAVVPGVTVTRTAKDGSRVTEPLRTPRRYRA